MSGGDGECSGPTLPPPGTFCSSHPCSSHKTWQAIGPDDLKGHFPTEMVKSVVLCSGCYHKQDAMALHDALAGKSPQSPEVSSYMSSYLGKSASVQNQDWRSISRQTKM